MAKCNQQLIKISCILSCFFLTSATPILHRDAIASHINYLTSTSLQGRKTGSLGEKKATNYVASYFHSLGLQPLGDNESFLQTFQVTPDTYTRNVLAFLRTPESTGPMLVISAHIDHLGLDKFGTPYPGADDNASGVAAVLSVAHALVDQQRQGKLHLRYPILFAIWSGEEIGLLGSTHFIKTKPLTYDIRFNINLDMIGHLQKALIIQGVGSSHAWERLIKTTQKTIDLPITLQPDPYLPTDSTAFYIHHIPTLNFFTGAHATYHSVNDTKETLNYSGIERITLFLLHFILNSETSPLTIRYQRVAKHHSQQIRHGLNIYFGTIPDYSDTKKLGVVLSGVAAESPAEKAGLQRGDRIVTLANQPIHDIYDYTRVLKTLHPGEITQIDIERRKKRLVLTIRGTSKEI